MKTLLGQLRVGFAAAIKVLLYEYRLGALIALSNLWGPLLFMYVAQIYAYDWLPRNVTSISSPYSLFYRI